MPDKIPALAAYKKSRWYKRSLWLGAIFLAYVLFGFFAVPAIIKSQLLKRLPPITKRQVAIQQVKFNPLVLSLTIRGLSLTEPDGQVFASWEEFYANFQLSSLFHLAWTFDEIALKKPYGHLILRKDGTMNLANMGDSSAPPYPPPSKPAKSGGLPGIRVGRLHVDDGTVVWDDETHLMPLHIELKPINFGLTNLTTQVGKGSEYSLVAGTDSGKRLAWIGSLVTQPFESHGHLELDGIEPRKWTAYLRDYLRAQVTNGRLNVAADYAIGAGTNGFGVVVRNGALELTGLEVKDANTNEVITVLPLLSIQSLDFDLLGRTLRAGSIKIDGLTKAIRVETSGALNLNLVVETRRALPPSTNAPPPPTPGPKVPPVPWLFAVDDFQFTNGVVAFADFSRHSAFATVLKPMFVRVEHFTTKADSDATFHFNLPSEAGEIVSGDGKLCVIPMRVSGTVNLNAIEIKKYAPYYEDFLRGEVLGGKLDSGLEYHLLAVPSATTLTISNAGVTLTDFQLKAADGGETVVAIPSFAVEHTEFSLNKQSVEVGLVKSADAKILARRKKDGAVNLAQLFGAPPRPEGETNAAENKAQAPASTEVHTNTESRPWTVLIKEVAFTNYAIGWQDQTLAKEVALGVDQLTFDVKNISTVSNEPIAATLSARLNEAGILEMGGTAKISPPAVDMDVTLSDLALRPLQPYLNQSVLIGINSGEFNLRSHVRYGEGEPKLKFTGDLSLTNLVTTDQALFKEFVKWDLLSVNGIDFALDPNQLQIKEINWRGFNTSVIIGPDHRLNLKTIMPPVATNATATSAVSSAAAPTAAPAQTNKSEFPIQIGTFSLENAAFHFADQSIEPNCAFGIADFGGSIKGLSSEQNATATVDLRGKVDIASPFSISGTVNPLARDLSLDLRVGFTNTDLTGFSTYLEKYAGHPLNKGKLFMGLHYDIHQKQLKAENVFMLDHFTLGPRNDSTNATHLPVKLAVALLKDQAGRINLDLPVTGRTDDPQFRVAPILWNALLNLMVKAATSPFSLLGSLVGGGGEELSFVQFAPGQTEISDAENQKLAKLVTALEQRPALNVEIAGSFDPQTDHDALAPLKLEQEIKTLRLKELTQSGRTVSGVEEIQLEPAQRERLLKIVIGEMGTNQTLVLQPVVAAQTNAVEAATNSVAASTLPVRPPATPATRHWQDTSGAESKGASLLNHDVQLTGLGPVKTPPPVPLSTGTNAAPATPLDIEARLIAAIQVSEDEKRDLMKRRAEAVQTVILKDGKISADRLFIVTPKTAAQAGKGEAKANLSLD